MLLEDAIWKRYFKTLFEDATWTNFPDLTKKMSIVDAD
jgi:hypothetical protein